MKVNTVKRNLFLNKTNGTINYDFFKIYTIGLLKWFKTFDPLYRRVAGEQKFNIRYENPERLWTDQNISQNNEMIDNPVLTIFLKSFSPLGRWNIPPSIKFPVIEKLPNGHINPFNSSIESKPKAFKLSYDATIMTEFKSDLDYILYSIQQQLDNGQNKYLIINGKYKTYMPIHIDQTQLTLGDIGGGESDILLKHSFTIDILNAYLPIDISKFIWTDNNIVKDINFNLESSLKDFNIELTKTTENIEIKENN